MGSRNKPPVTNKLELGSWELGFAEQESSECGILRLTSFQSAMMGLGIDENGGSFASIAERT